MDNSLRITSEFRDNRIYLSKFALKILKFPQLLEKHQLRRTKIINRNTDKAVTERSILGHSSTR